MKIAFEGGDGVGKTTIARKIAEMNGFMYIDKPLHYFFEDKQEDDYKDFMKVASRIYDIDDPVIRAWFFGLGNLYCFRNFADKDLVIDRHFVSNYFWNGDETSEKVFSTMIDIIGVPDLTVLLYASPKTRMARLYKRNHNDGDLYDPDKKVDGYDKMLSFLERFKLPYVVIDTEDKTIESITEEVNSIITIMRDKEKGTCKKLSKEIC